MIFLNLATQNTIETKKNHLSSTSTRWDRYSMFNDVMTSFPDDIPSCKYDDNNQVEFSHQRNHRNGNGSSSRTHLQAEMKAVRFLKSRSTFSDFLTSRYDMKTSCKYIHHNSWSPATEIFTEINVYHHFRTTTSWYRRSVFCDIMTIMTSRHDVMTSWKHKNDNIFELSKPENYRNKKRIISLALLQAEIEYSLFLTSRHDVMTWRHHANTNLTFSISATQSIIETKKNHHFSTSTSWDKENKFGYVMPWRHDVTVSRGWVKSNLSTVSCEWDLELWKNGTFSWSKNFLI